MISSSSIWTELKQHVAHVEQCHLRDLLRDKKRCAQMLVQHDNIVLDYSRQNMTLDTLPLLIKLAETAQLKNKMNAMQHGEPINRTENRAVMHIALRAQAQEDYRVNGENVLPEVERVRQQIAQFSEEIRSSKKLSANGKPFKNVIAIGIGGSYLGGEFVSESLKNHADCRTSSVGRQLRFLANIDPIDFQRAIAGLSADETLVIVISKTFTTTETMLNARAAKAWLIEELGEAAVAKQMVAVSTNLNAVAAFGISAEHIFGFWDWVGGRYSVCSAVGLLPLALHYGWKNTQQFLDGARAIDQHFLTAPLEQNLPVLLGLIGVWNSSFLNRSARVLLPYCQALHRFAAHIQQVDMESNGKRVSINGEPLDFEAGEVDFGEPGTNGQHSFYQLIHQGRVIPADFIGFKKSQSPLKLADNALDNHDELMANFFAQPDALALGKSASDLRAQGVDEALIAHREFPGNRPSTVLLLDELTPYSCGQLLALYEHRTAVQGFIWDLNSFDQWGVELGKVLAQQVRQSLVNKAPESDASLPYSTQQLMRHYLS